MSYTRTEENYLKAIYSLKIKHGKDVSTNSLAGRLDTKASSITDMIKKLSVKKLVEYEKYKGVNLTNKGKSVAINIIRNHRLWEVFLVEKLNFKWDEVHELAEQLEHINSEKLIDNLDLFLEFPKFDPHGDPIPTKDGKIPKREESFLVSEVKVGTVGIIVGVKNSEIEFLQFLEEMNLTLGKEIKVEKEFTFDKSRTVYMGTKELTLSEQVCKNIIIKIK
jgi:DtxR family Mn-dependent transcriptional regulator